MVHIITDTTACLSAQAAQKLGIPVIPQVIIFGEQEFLEGVDMDIQEFHQRLRDSREIPKTAAPPISEFSKVFAQLVPTGEPILCIHPSSDVSGTVRSALTAAADYPGADIRVIDTRLIASPLAVMVTKAAAWAQAGEGGDEIEAKVREMSSRSRVYFMVPSLDFLARGGRIGGAQVLLGSLLQIKPILSFKDGRVDQYEKARTFKHALKRLEEIAIEQAPHDRDPYLTVLHAGVPDQGRQLASDLGSALGFKDIGVYDMPPAIVTHAGPGLLGIGFFQ
jgi:DegV family protein with EDD domain